MTTPLDDVLAWLDTLPPVQRARYLTALLDARNTRALSAIRVAAVYEATRTASYADVAAAVGVSQSMVNKAVTRHRQATAAHPSPIDTSG